MASLTPARILGLDADLGSLEVGKRGDVLLLDRGLGVAKVWVEGRAVGWACGAGTNEWGVAR
jgi:N-acetylglucosamine-6-phosphate deacetylase